MKPRTVWNAQYYPFNCKRDWDRARRLTAIIVRDALRTGQLARQPCEECGDRGAEAHHDDYGQPLVIRWLCRRHHRQYHETHAPIVSSVPSRPPVRRHRSHLCDAASVALTKAITDAVTAELIAQDINQNILAQRLCVSRQALNTMVNGGFRTFKTLAAVADALDCNVSVTLVRRHAQEDEATHAA